MVRIGPDCDGTCTTGLLAIIVLLLLATAAAADEVRSDGGYYDSPIGMPRVFHPETVTRLPSLSSWNWAAMAGGDFHGPGTSSRLFYKLECGYRVGSASVDNENPADNLDRLRHTFGMQFGFDRLRPVESPSWQDKLGLRDNANIQRRVIEERDRFALFVLASGTAPENRIGQFGLVDTVEAGAKFNTGIEIVAVTLHLRVGGSFDGEYVSDRFLGEFRWLWEIGASASIHQFRVGLFFFNNFDFTDSRRLLRHTFFLDWFINGYQSWPDVVVWLGLYVDGRAGPSGNEEFVAIRAGAAARFHHFELELVQTVRIAGQLESEVLTRLGLLFRF